MMFIIINCSINIGSIIFFCISISNPQLWFPVTCICIIFSERMIPTWIFWFYAWEVAFKNIFYCPLQISFRNILAIFRFQNMCSILSCIIFSMSFSPSQVQVSQLRAGIVSFSGLYIFSSSSYQKPGNFLNRYQYSVSMNCEIILLISLKMFFLRIITPFLKIICFARKGIKLLV